MRTDRYEDDDDNNIGDILRIDENNILPAVEIIPRPQASTRPRRSVWL
jgi:hypothetical protein